MKKTLSLLLTFLMIFSTINVAFVAAYDEYGEDTPERLYYGSQLNELEGYIYDCIMEKGADMINTNSNNKLIINVPDDIAMSISFARSLVDYDGKTAQYDSRIQALPQFLEAYDALHKSFQRAIDAFILDSYDTSWSSSYMRGSSYVRGTTGDLMIVTFKTLTLYNHSMQYPTAADDVEDVDEELARIEQEIRESLSYNPTKYEIVAKINDYIGNMVTYFPNTSDYDAIQANGQIFTVAGAVLSKYKNQAVCQGYARLYRYLLHQFDIENIIVRGGSRYDSQDQLIVDHMWNYIKMDDGQWYGSDVTWNDRSEKAVAMVYKDFLLAGSDTVPVHYSPIRFANNHIPDGTVDGRYVDDEVFVLPEISDKYYVNIHFDEEEFEIFADENIDLRGILFIESPYDEKTLTFTSSNPDVVRINSEHALGLKSGTSVITATFNTNYVAEVSLSVIDHVYSITPDEDTIVTDVGTSVRISFTSDPEGKVAATDIAWSSSDESKATVDENGIVNPVGPGTVIITGKYDEFSFEVTVKIVQYINNIEINDNPGPDAQHRDVIIKGQTKQLTVSCNPVGYTESYFWKSSDDKIATVVDGNVTAISGGNVLITVSSESGRVVDEYYLYVRVPMTGISLEYPTHDDEIVLAGEQLEPIVTFYPSDTNDNRQISFSVDGSYCTVDTAGNITAGTPEKNKVGYATVKAVSVNGFTHSFSFLIKNPTESFTVYENGEEVSEISMIKGGETSLTYKADYENSYEGHVEWISDNDSIVSVDQSGNVTANDGGRTRIGIKNDLGVESYVNVFVRVPIEELIVSVDRNHLNTNDAISPAIEYNPEDNTDVEQYGIEIASSDENVAYIEDGAIHTNAPGFTYISVKVGEVEDGFNLHVYEVPQISVESELAEGITLAWEPMPTVDRYIVYRTTNVKAKTVDDYDEIATISADEFEGTYTDKTSEAETRYMYICVAATDCWDGEFLSPASNSVDAYVGIVKPKILSVKAKSSTELIVTWEKIDVATSYILQYSMDEVNFTTIAEVGENTLSYTHGGLGYEYLYFYRVIAKVGNSESRPSATVMGRTKIPAAKLLTVESASYNSITIKWEAMKSVSGYKLYRSENTDDNWKEIKAIANRNTVTYTDENLISGTLYYYKICAYIDVDSETFIGGYSNALSAKAVPPNPKLTSVIRKSNTSAAITWQAVKGATGYRIYRSTTATGGFKEVTTTTSPTVLTYTDTKLTCGATYYYTARAYTRVDGSDVWSGYNAGVGVTITPSKPTISKATCASYNSIKLTWNKIAEANGYYIYRTTKSDGTGWKAIKTITKNTVLTYTDTTALCGVTYYYTIRSYITYNKKNVLSDYDKPGISCKTTLLTPKIQGAISTNYNSIKLNWAKITGADGYVLYRSTKQTSGWKKVATAVGGTKTSVIDKTAVCGTQYYYTLRAYRNVNNAPVYSGYVKTGIAGKAVPNTPVLSKANIINNKKISLTWNKIDGASGYVVYRSTKASSGFKAIKTITKGTTITFNDTTVTNATKTKYYYTVRSFRTVGTKKIYSTLKTPGKLAVK